MENDSNEKKSRGVDSADGRELTTEEKTELRRAKFRKEMEAVDLGEGVSQQIDEQQGMQRVRKMSPATAARVKDAHLEGVRSLAVVDGSGGSIHGSEEDDDGSPTVEVDVVEDPDPYRDEIAAVAKRTPEVRFTKAHMLRAFNSDEIKIIAAALRTSVPLYRVADVLHCSVHKIENAIRDVPILNELAQEKIKRRKEQAQEAVDDCVKARVPAVVMWNAEKLLPEIYGNQVDLNNEDDTKLVIGALSEEDLKEADAAVAAAGEGVPEVEVGAVMEVLQEERGAELAAAGGGIPVSPLQSVPPAPALRPPAGDSRFGGFVPAGEMNRAPIIPTPSVDEGPDNYGIFGGGMDDDMGGNGLW